MCIIAIKPARVKRPTDKQFVAMCKANPNGFGFVTWTKESGLIVKKTMDEKTYLKWVKDIPDEQPVIYHMRIATHGSINEKNCHPFLSDDKNWAFAHNGILSIQNEGDMTDSETFFRRLAVPMLKAGFKPNDKGDFDAMVDTIIGASKFVFMDNNGSIYSYGNFIHDGELYFSNPSYIPYDDYRALIPTCLDSCYGKKHKKSKKNKKEKPAIDTDMVDTVTDQLYNGMMNEPFFFDKSKEEIYKDYKDFVSWTEFEMAWDEAENLLYDEMNYNDSYYITDEKDDSAKTNELKDFANDVYDVLASNDANITQQEFFDKYIGNDTDVDVELEIDSTMSIITIGKFSIEIYKNE